MLFDSFQKCQGFSALKSKEHSIVNQCELTAKACPMKIILVKET